MGDSISGLPPPRELAGLTLIREKQPPEQEPFSLTTTLKSLIPETQEQSKKAVAVGPSSPPVPVKLAEKIWQGEYIDLQELLPSRLGAPSSTVLDALLKPEKIKARKSITSIEDWVSCFNSFISIMAIRKPERVRDLLAYSSLIVKASQDFVGSPWLEYDTQFRQLAATRPDTDWATVDAAIWTVHFARATPKALWGTRKGGQWRSAPVQVRPVSESTGPCVLQMELAWGMSPRGLQVCSCVLRLLGAPPHSVRVS